MSEHTDKLEKRYGKSRRGNFRVIDTIGVPHPYCVGARHVEIAADRFCGILGPDAIEEAERCGVTCRTCKGDLSYKEHETGLLVSFKKDLKGNKELHAYLLDIRDKAVEDKYAGFAFIDERVKP